MRLTGEDRMPRSGVEGFTASDGVPAAVARQPGHRVLRLESGDHVAPRRILAGKKNPDLHDPSQPRQVASSGKLVDDRPQRGKDTRKCGGQL